MAVTVGQGVTFSVTAATTAASTSSYQWSRDGNPISGASAASYSMAAVSMADNGAAFSVVLKNTGGTTLSTAARLTVNAAAVQVASAARPFSDQSLWNARPTKFVLGSYQVPTSNYFPTVAAGDYSLSASVASPSDGPMTVMGPDAGGIWIADAEVKVAQIVIPHWPANVATVSGDDGHADIIDVAGNKIHSFWQLRKDGTQWRAAQYTWTKLDGSGWGTPGQYMQGARAAGVPTIAGVIRLNEIDDGQASYRHALAMSMPFEALASSPTFVFPATSADADAQWANKGGIPEGGLMMLPASFDSSLISNPRLRKIVQTLKSYGAYVVDRNFGTPFLIYVENGNNFQLMPNGWDNQIASELDLIRSNLRQVASVTEWVDANGLTFTPERNANLLSMRGPWYGLQGTALGTFDTWTQAVTFPNSGQQILQINATGRSTPSMIGNAPKAGKTFRMVVTGSGGATINMNFNAGGKTVYETGFVGNGAVVTFTWPVDNIYPWMVVSSNAQGGGQISATLVAVD